MWDGATPPMDTDPNPNPKAGQEINDDDNGNGPLDDSLQILSFDSDWDIDDENWWIKYHFK